MARLSSNISSAVLEKVRESANENKQSSVSLNLSFKIEGAIREAFSQKNWEKAYNKHDNGFRMTINVDLKSGRRIVLSQKFVRKAALFWTRNPKITHRIWVSIVKDDTPFYPLKEEEARSLLFDVDKTFELPSSEIPSNMRNLSADISVSWGRHEYAEPETISSKSNEIELSTTNAI